LELANQQAVRGWLKVPPQRYFSFAGPLQNKDGSIGLLNLVCSDLACNGEQVATSYQKRWKVEELHKSLKSNAGLAKSPTRTVTHRTATFHVNLRSVKTGVPED
jgi:hypothetical protein